MEHLQNEVKQQLGPQILINIIIVLNSVSDISGNVLVFNSQPVCQGVCDKFFLQTKPATEIFAIDCK